MHYGPLFAIPFMFENLFFIIWKNSFTEKNSIDLNGVDKIVDLQFCEYRFRNETHFHRTSLENMLNVWINT